MSTQKRISKSEAIAATVKSVRIWISTFAVFAAITIASSIAGEQSVIATGVMIVAAAMVVLHATKYDAHFEPVAVRVEASR
jgi:hypothetical protein